MAAIYSWFQSVEEEYTSTLYPIEIADGISFSIALDFGTLSPIETDSVILHTSVIGATLTNTLLSAPEQLDSMKLTSSVLAGSLIQTLLSAPEQTDGMKLTTSVIDATLDAVLITTYFPDEGLWFAIALDSAACSMTGI